jgi:hypothetical protein
VNFALLFKFGKWWLRCIWFCAHCMGLCCVGSFRILHSKRVRKIRSAELQHLYTF